MEKLELSILMIVIFAFGYIAVDHFSRFMDKVHRDTYNYRHIESKSQIEWADDAGTFENEQEEEYSRVNHGEKALEDSGKKE